MHPEDVGLEALPQTKVGHPAGDDPRLVKGSRPELERRADAEVVVLAAPGAQRGELHLHVLIGVAPVVQQQMRPAVRSDHDQVQVAVVIPVHRRDIARRPQIAGQARRPILEATGAIVAKQEDSPAGDGEVEIAVVVEIEKSGAERSGAGETPE